MPVTISDKKALFQKLPTSIEELTREIENYQEFKPFLNKYRQHLVATPTAESGQAEVLTKNHLSRLWHDSKFSANISSPEYKLSDLSENDPISISEYLQLLTPELLDRSTMEKFRSIEKKFCEANLLERIFSDKNTLVELLSKINTLLNFFTNSSPLDALKLLTNVHISIDLQSGNCEISPENSTHTNIPILVAIKLLSAEQILDYSNITLTEACFNRIKKQMNRMLDFQISRPSNQSDLEKEHPLKQPPASNDSVHFSLEETSNEEATSLINLLLQHPLGRSSDKVSKSAKALLKQRNIQESLLNDAISYLSENSEIKGFDTLFLGSAYSSMNELQDFSGYVLNWLEQTPELIGTTYKTPKNCRGNRSYKSSPLPITSSLINTLSDFQSFLQETASQTNHPERLKQIQTAKEHIDSFLPDGLENIDTWASKTRGDLINFFEGMAHFSEQISAPLPLDLSHNFEYHTTQPPPPPSIELQKLSSIDFGQTSHFELGNMSISDFSNNELFLKKLRTMLVESPRFGVKLQPVTDGLTSTLNAQSSGVISVKSMNYIEINKWNFLLTADHSSNPVSIRIICIQNTEKTREKGLNSALQLSNRAIFNKLSEEIGVASSSFLKNQSVINSMIKSTMTYENTKKNLRFKFKSEKDISSLGLAILAKLHDPKSVSTFAQPTQSCSLSELWLDQYRAKQTSSFSKLMHISTEVNNIMTKLYTQKGENLPEKCALGLDAEEHLIRINDLAPSDQIKSTQAFKHWVNTHLVNTLTLCINSLETLIKEGTHFKKTFDSDTLLSKINILENIKLKFTRKIKSSQDNKIYIHDLESLNNSLAILFHATSLPGAFESLILAEDQKQIRMQEPKFDEHYNLIPKKTSMQEVAIGDEANSFELLFKEIAKILYHYPHDHHSPEYRRFAGLGYRSTHPNNRQEDNAVYPAQITHDEFLVSSSTCKKYFSQPHDLTPEPEPPHLAPKLKTYVHDRSHIFDAGEKVAVLPELSEHRKVFESETHAMPKATIAAHQTSTSMQTNPSAEARKLFKKLIDKGERPLGKALISAANRPMLPEDYYNQFVTLSLKSKNTLLWSDHLQTQFKGDASKSHLNPVEDYYRNPPHITTAYEIHNPPGKPKLTVFFHAGLGTNKNSCPESLIKTLLENGFQVVLMDPPATGYADSYDEDSIDGIAHYGSEQPELSMSYDTMVDLVVQLKAYLISSKQIEDRPIGFIGFSMGGMLGFRLVCDYPQDIFAFNSEMSSFGSPYVPGAIPDLTPQNGLTEQLPGYDDEFLTPHTPTQTVREFIRWAFNKKHLNFLTHNRGELLTELEIDDLIRLFYAKESYMPALFASLTQTAKTARKVGDLLKNSMSSRTKPLTQTSSNTSATKIECSFLTLLAGYDVAPNCAPQLLCTLRTTNSGLLSQEVVRLIKVPTLITNGTADAVFASFSRCSPTTIESFLNPAPEFRKYLECGTLCEITKHIIEETRKKDNDPRKVLPDFILTHTAEGAGHFLCHTNAYQMARRFIDITFPFAEKVRSHPEHARLIEEDRLRSENGEIRKFVYENDHLGSYVCLSKKEIATRMINEFYLRQKVRAYEETTELKDTIRLWLLARASVILNCSVNRLNDSKMSKIKEDRFSYLWKVYQNTPLNEEDKLLLKQRLAEHPLNTSPIGGKTSLMALENSNHTKRAV